ncbi:DUF1428 domain-containing protein [Brevundimonas sp. SORGH_AS_0993]|uniref:DUF1428 domain-containing protein n=1 Tax=Brevundimonas sp. SORGH_AS_0993 TaxID=3041794 RepID=UPI002785AA59|nr:DUF1428 domain-containing protein [Brevundimonas sp. SORGH_AS_0993]MDQ1155592.1 uncharacterized protein YbaA (DUF1428 family) [Brevundimonas sp. SORGH_AS_0993]
MSFLDITVIAVPTENRAAYLEHSRASTIVFKEHGALKVTETWGEDVPEGEQTDFRRAVALKEGETVAVGWITWPDKATRDAAWEKMMQDERLAGADMPFDGKRMIFGGFETLIDG